MSSFGKTSNFSSKRTASPPLNSSVRPHDADSSNSPHCCLRWRLVGTRCRAVGPMDEPPSRPSGRPHLQFNIAVFFFFVPLRSRVLFRHWQEHWRNQSLLVPRSSAAEVLLGHFKTHVLLVRRCRGIRYRLVLSPVASVAYLVRRIVSWCRSNISFEADGFAAAQFQR